MARIMKRITVFAFLFVSFIANQSFALYLDDYDQIEFNMSFSTSTLIKDAASTMFDWGLKAHRRVKNRLYPYQMLSETLLRKDCPHLLMATAIMMAGHDMAHPGQMRNAAIFMANLDEQRTMDNEDFRLAVQRIEDMQRSPLFMDLYTAAMRIDEWQTNVLLKSLIGEFLVQEMDHAPYLSSMLLIVMIDEVTSFQPQRS